MTVQGSVSGCLGLAMRELDWIRLLLLDRERERDFEILKRGNSSSSEREAGGRSRKEVGCSCDGAGS